MNDATDEKLREQAQAPAKVSGDAGSVEQHPLPDQIEADRYLAAKEAIKKRNRGLRLNKLVPPGAD